MTVSALVVGGTATTALGVISGLLQRGFVVSILHGGQHEIDLLAEARHIHAGPH